MYLTLSKRFEFSASRRLILHDRNEGQNLAAYGPLSKPPHGAGDNFVLAVILHGSIDKQTGMMISLSEVKRRVCKLLDRSYDHKFLNIDNLAFASTPPTVEFMATTLLADICELFDGESTRPVACHLMETPFSGATAFTDGRVEREIWLEFSAARRTYSPNLSDQENQRLFGAASNPAGHGHNYQLRLTISGELHPSYGTIVPYKQMHKAGPILRKRLDHRHINKEVSELKGQPITSETISRYIFERLEHVLPIVRLRLYELPTFFVEYDSEQKANLGMVASFRAAHRLHSPTMSQEENIRCYGKCNNANGHGHRYQVEALVSGSIDETTGIAFDFVAMQEGMEEAISVYDMRHLELETDDFASSPSTGENIISALWPRMDAGLRGQLTRLRLWETPNNRFTLRREIPGQ